MNSKIWYRMNESVPHEGSSHVFEKIFEEAINEKESKTKLSIANLSTVIFNKFNCGVAQKKYLTQQYQDGTLKI
jgi:hypothetical protein